MTHIQELEWTRAYCQDQVGHAKGHAGRCRRFPVCIIYVHIPYDCLIVLLRTQETLDEGVEKMRKIYKQFDQVGIKDRSMIWNS